MGDTRTPPPESTRAAVDEVIRELGLAVDGDATAAHVVACEADAAHIADVVVACGATAGDPAALRAFESRVGSEIEWAARKIDAADSFVDEVRQAVRIRLLVAADDEAPRLARYRGHGSLRAWVRVTATRVALNLKRDAARPLAPAEVLESMVADEPDPELAHLKQLYRTEFRAALEDAIAALPDRQRALLRLAYVDGLKLAQIGHLYQVHESTISRWLSKATGAVAAATRTRVVERLSLSPATADSVARMVRSQIELSIARILRTSAISK